VDAEHVLRSGDVVGAGQMILSLVELANAKGETVRSKVTVEDSHSRATYFVTVERTDRQ